MTRVIVKHALVTEKATGLANTGTYVFLVDVSSTKPEIKKFVEMKYRVEVEHVRIINVAAKERRLGRTVGVKSGYKKALVKLKPGHKLDVLPT